MAKKKKYTVCVVAKIEFTKYLNVEAASEKEACEMAKTQSGEEDPITDSSWGNEDPAKFSYEIERGDAE